MAEDPNTLCGKLAVGLVLAIGLGWLRKVFSLGSALAAGFVSLATIPAILASGSRGGLVSVIVGLAVLAFPTIDFRRGLAALGRIALMTLVSGGLVLGFRSNEMVMKRWRGVADGDWSMRQDLYPYAVEMIARKPLVGWGPIENYIEACRATGKRAGIQSTENTFAWALTSLGFLGAAPFLYVIYLGGRSAWVLRRSSCSWTPMAALATTLTFSCAVEWHHVKVFWLILGLTMALASSSRSDRQLVGRFVSDDDADGDRGRS